MMLTLIGESLKLAGETLKAAADVAAETVALTGVGESTLALPEVVNTTALTGVNEALAQAPAVPRLYGTGVRAQFLHDTGSAFELGDFLGAIDDLDALEGVDEATPLTEDPMEQQVLEEFSKAGRLPQGYSAPTGLYASPDRLRANGLREGEGQAFAVEDIPGGPEVYLAGNRNRRRLFRGLGALEGQLESVQNAQSRR